jgi:hypothetical protein
MTTSNVKVAEVRIDDISSATVSEHAGRFSALPRRHQQFLLVEQGIGSVPVNLLINGAMAWLAFRSAASVPMWGASSIAVDTMITAFVLPLMTSLIASRVVAWQLRFGLVPPLPSGRVSGWARRSNVQLGAALGTAAVVFVALPTIGILTLAGPAALALWPFIWLKATFAAALGAVVTPIVAWRTLVRASA